MSRVGVVAVSKPALGGTYQYSIAMIEALLRIPGNQYTLFTTRGNHAFDHLGIEVQWLPTGVVSVGARLARIFGASKAGLFSQVEKVIAPIYTTHLLASARPFAFTLHDVQERYYPQYFSIAQRLWRRMANTLLCANAVAIVCESTFVKSDIQRFFNVEPGKVAVIPAPPMSVFREEDLSPVAVAEAMRRLRLPEQYLFYPAQFFPHKNHLRLVEAFRTVVARNPLCRLVFTGQQRYEFAAVMRRANTLGLKDSVRHLGFLSTAELAAAYRGATAVVVPTLFESISIPIYEAFTLGIPVCASNIVALPEQVGDAGLLFDPMSSDDMSDKICQVLNDACLREQLVERGRARIACLTMERYSAALGEVLGRLG